jgi:hypothetical protein
MLRFLLDGRIQVRLARNGWFVACLAMLSGCDGSYKSAPVKVDVAHQSLTSVLEGWKDGQTPEDLRNQSPSIVVQDLDWSAGMKLVDCDILDDGKAVDAILYARVKLKPGDADGKDREKTVTYIVGTSPAIAVIRGLTR